MPLGEDGEWRGVASHQVTYYALCLGSRSRNGVGIMEAVWE